MRVIVLFFLISGMLTACGGSDSNDKNKANPADKLQIVSSIKPIQSIVLAIAGDYAQSEQLIPDYASPHDYSFKPSDIRKTKSADVVFRIDDHMETQLNGILGNSGGNIKLISLAEIKGLKLLQSEDTEHGHENVDFHIWTSPKNAIVIAEVVTKTLSELDSKNAKNYEQNFMKFEGLLKAESDKISSKLVKHHKTPYIVFHNSWQYFANEFGLQKPIVVDLHEGFSSGAKTLSEIHDKIAKQNIQCIFYDSSVSHARLKVLSGEIKTTLIDVLAKDITLNQSSYVDWLSQLSEQVDSCLSR